jgi:outer membrane protein assembly factor BamE (lipoprotein component of BamABCDE complex)
LQLNSSVRQTLEGARELTNVLGRVLAIVLVVAMSTGCATLRPRTTLEGRPFNVANVASVTAGLRESEVRALLGEPFEVLAGHPGLVWRYYERFTPRGCDPGPPVITQEFRVSLVGGRVVSTDPLIPGAVR